MTVEERLEALERKVNLYRWLFLCACVLSVVLAGTSAIAVQSKELRANSFILEDESGRTRGVLTTTTKQETKLAFYDTNGSEHLSLVDSPLHSTLFIAGDTPRGSIILSSAPTGSFLTLGDRDGLVRTQLGIFPGEREASFSLYDGNGDPRFQIFLKPENTFLTLNERGGTRPETKRQIALGVSDAGSGVGIRDSQGNIGWSTPIVK